MNDGVYTTIKNRAHDGRVSDRSDVIGVWALRDVQTGHAMTGGTKAQG